MRKIAHKSLGIITHKPHQICLKKPAARVTISRWSSGDQILTPLEKESPDAIFILGNPDTFSSLRVLPGFGLTKGLNLNISLFFNNHR